MNPSADKSGGCVMRGIISGSFASCVLVIAGLLTTGCNDGGSFSRAYRISNRAQTIGGTSALADLGDYVLENDEIRLAFPEAGNSVGPGVFGGSLIDADLQRTDAGHRLGRGLDQFSELFPIGNLAIPAVCKHDNKKVDGFCSFPGKALDPRVRVLCDGSKPCLTCYGKDDCLQKDAQIDLSKQLNKDYASPDDPTQPGPGIPSPQAAVIRVEGMSGNYLEALGLVSIAKVKMNFRMRNDFILEPGSKVVRIRTLVMEAGRDGSLLRPDGKIMKLPSLNKPRALFALLLGSDYFHTELPDMDPGIAGGDFLFFGDRLKLFAPGIGFDVYREIRNKFAVGDDPLNNPIAAPYLAAVGQGVSYAIASADPNGKYLLPILSGAVTAGFTHGAHCHAGPCEGTAEQCANVVDCTQAMGFFFERLFAVGDGDVASAASAIMEARGEELGTVSGQVLDSVTHAPVTHAQVYIYQVPRTMAQCRPGGASDKAYTGGAGDFEKECLVPRDYQWVFSHMKTDADVMDLPVGRFAGRILPGDYYLLAKVRNRPTSLVKHLKLEAGGETEVVLELRPPAKISFTVRDEKNEFVPSKLTVGQCLPNCSLRLEQDCEQDADCSSGKCVMVADGKYRCQVDNCSQDRLCNAESLRCEYRNSCTEDTDCEPVERCMNGRCVCNRSYVRKAALGEGTFPAGIVRYAYTADGKGEIEVEPGSYEVWASRGFEYSVDKQQVRAVENRTVQLALRVNHQVDTTGWITGDFHVHGQNSYDAVVKHRDRVICFAGEGMDLLSTSDHDYVTNLAPYALELGLDKWLKTQVGLELTTVEIGHWLAFPLRYEEWKEGKRLQEQGAVDWTGLFPEQIHSSLRALGRYGPEDTVLVVAHPRDSFFGYFDQFGLNEFDPSKVEGSMFEYLPPFHENPIAVPEAFSGTFDALELFNSKRFELIRTPTVAEMRDYNQAQAMIRSQALTGADPAVIERQLINLDHEIIKDILKRSPSEQNAIWDSDGSGGCELLTFCTSDSDCAQDEGQLCDRVAMACYKPCLEDLDCPDSSCINERCAPLADGANPCTSHQGVVDDWFRLLDYGVVRTGMGNSDSHQLFSQTEGGLPRNFVKLDAQTPMAIDSRKVARAIKRGAVVPSYGPFIQVWLDGTTLGDGPVSANGKNTLPLRIRVQSPDWFDVDRVEVYRSGRLIHVLTGDGDEINPELQVDTSGLKLPNYSSVNLDVTLDEPVPESDSWYVVIAMGLGGRDLSPVYTEHPYLKLQIGDILSRSFSSVPLPFDISSPSVPRVFRIYPYAITNPVFVDVDGNGSYDAPHPTPTWAGGSALGSKTTPLSSSRIGGSPLTRPMSQGDFRQGQLRYFMSLMKRLMVHGRIR